MAAPHLPTHLGWGHVPFGRMPVHVPKAGCTAHCVYAGGAPRRPRRGTRRQWATSSRGRAPAVWSQRRRTGRGKVRFVRGAATAVLLWTPCATVRPVLPPMPGHRVPIWQAILVLASSLCGFCCFVPSPLLLLLACFSWHHMHAPVPACCLCRVQHERDCGEDRRGCRGGARLARLVAGRLLAGELALPEAWRGSPGCCAG